MYVCNLILSVGFVGYRDEGVHSASPRHAAPGILGTVPPRLMYNGSLVFQAFSLPHIVCQVVPQVSLPRMRCQAVPLAEAR